MAWRKKICILGTMLLCTSMLYAGSPAMQAQEVDRGLQSATPSAFNVGEAASLNVDVRQLGDGVVETKNRVEPMSAEMRQELGILRIKKAENARRLSQLQFNAETPLVYSADKGGCPDGTLTVEIYTDEYASETEWEVIEHDSGTVLAFGGPYTDGAQTLITEDVCVSSATGCYDFVIYDEYGDGICCNYGEGYYNIYLDSTLVATGAEFGTSEEVEYIGGGCVIPTGACCEGTACTGTVTEAECAGRWFEGEDCSTFVCPSDPLACPEDGLIFGQAVEATAIWGGSSDVGPNLLRYESLEVGGLVSRVHFWGFNAFHDGSAWGPCDENPMNFEIKFYQDSGYQPGTEICSYTVSLTGVETGTNLSGYDLLAYEATLPTACNVPNGGWISIQGTGGDSCWFLWEDAVSGDGSSYLWDGDDGTLEEDDADLAVCILQPAAPGACCDDDSVEGTCTDDVEFADCPAGYRFVPSVLCADLTPACGEMTGACCYDDGSCSVEEEVACLANGGTYKGDLTTCDSNPCVQACCFDDGSCQALSTSMCTAAGGIAQAEGTSCDPNMCPQPIPTCPDENLIYGQNVHSPDDGWAAGISDDARELTRYEMFGSGAMIDGVRWWGVELDFSTYAECAVDPGTFEISFYSDAGYTPGALVGSEVVTPTKTATGLLYHDTYQIPMYEYSVTLSSPVVMPSGGWISIQHVGNTTTGACYFAWMSSGDGDGVHCTEEDGAMTCGGDDYSYDFSLCLSGQTGTYYGACCNDDTGICSDNVASTACYPPQRWVYDTLCADLDPQCGELTGACCDPIDGSCQVVKENECDGNYLGDWTDCDPNPCAQPGDDCTNPLQFSLPGICGDMDSDGDCDNDDYWAFVDCFGWCEGQPKYSEAGDADADGCITFADYQAWIACYREYGAKEVGDVMYVDSNGYTCGRGNAYADTCLGYYDGGEDVIYEVTVTAAMDVEITLDPGATTYTGIALSDSCPLGDTCLYTSTNTSAGIHSLGCKHLEPGTYYIMIDTWPAPDCIDAYTLKVTECEPPTGRCCYGTEPVECADVVEGDCVMLGGVWAEGLTCADNPCPAPVAETCEDAVVVDAVPFAYGFDNDEATPDGPAGTCDEYGATGNMQNDVWFVWTAAEDCTALVTVEAVYDSIIVVRDGCDTLVELACADEGGIGDTEQAAFSAVAGTTYYIQAGDNGSIEGGGEATLTIECTSGLGACCYPDGTCADVALDECTGTFQGIGTTCAEVTCPIVPQNDTCDFATVITTVPYATEVDNSDANANEPSCNTSYTTTQNDVWYAYTTPAEGCQMHVEVFEIDSYDTVMGVYTGPDCDNLTEFDCLDDPDGYTLDFTATGDTTYWFQIGDYGSTAGGGLTSFELYCGDAPEGACCVDGACTATTTEADCAGTWFEGETCPEFTGCPQPCTEDTITVTILTDNYADETSWTLTDQATSTVVASGDSYEDATTYEVEVCADFGTCFDFVIVDSYGDGIFSPGGYTLDLNGTVIADTMGGGFTSSTETAIIGSGCVYPTGACCEGTACTGTVTEAECAGVWFEGEDCATFECPEGPTCPADSLQSQLPHAADSGDLVGFPADTGTSTPRVLADNYSVSADICSMSFWGARNESGWVQCDEDPMTFDIKFHQDSGYQPGTVVSSYTVTANANWAGEGWWGTDTLWRWDIDLAANGGCVSLQEGWVSIQSTSDPQTCWFLWVSSPDGNGGCMLSEDDGATWTADTYGVDLSMCLNPASGLLGSCCDDSDGTCTDDVAAGDCEGRWTAGVACADLDPACGQIEGACCFEDGTCSVGSEADCTTNGGTYQGDGTDCDPNPCPQPGPDNDTCAEAEVVDCGVTLTGETTTNATNDYTLTGDGCTGYAANGPDVVYSLTLAAAQRVTVTATPDAWDLALYVITDCADAEGTCVGGNDSGLGGIAEDVAFDAEAGVTYYIIVDGYNASANGVFDISVACGSVPTGGACCHADGSCTDEADEAACTAAGGTYEGDGTECASTDCPQPCAGDIQVDFGAGLPYSDTNTTCGAGNDYSDTCMGSYDGGEELVYELIVPNDICVNISMTSDTSWTGIALGSTCPVGCDWMDTGSGTDKELTSVNLVAGTYYLMLDTYPSPNCINDYTLSITECPTGGACCHSDGSCTDEADEAACTAAGGTFEGDGTECASTDCPQPPPANDTCAAPTAVQCGDVLVAETTAGAANDYDPTGDGCTGYKAEGGDVVYSLVLDTAQDVTVSMATTWDASLYVVTDCGDMTTCVAGDDSGNPEEVTFLGEIGVTYYIIADAYSSGVGEFDLSVSCADPVADAPNGFEPREHVIGTPVNMSATAIDSVNIGR